MAESIGTQARQRTTRTYANTPTGLGVELFGVNALGSPRSADPLAIIAQKPNFTPFYINKRTHGRRKVDPETQNKTNEKINLLIN